VVRFAGLFATATASTGGDDMGTDSAVSREAAWLSVTTDSLPVLPSPAGPWNLVQAYPPGNRFAANKTGIYVDAREVTDLRVSNQRIRPQYEFTLTLIWPVKGGGAPLAEGAQQAMASAIDLLVQRIRGPVGDKTHGGAFLSVAENPRSVRLSKMDPETTIPGDDRIRCAVTYRADDLEISG
jgi:hypothetical protein